LYSVRASTMSSASAAVRGPRTPAASAASSACIASATDASEIPPTSGVVYERPVVLVLYRQDHGFLLDTVIPRRGAEAPWLTVRPLPAANSLVWHEVPLSGNSAHEFEAQITDLQPFLAKNWKAGVSKTTGNPADRRLRPGDRSQPYPRALRPG